MVKKSPKICVYKVLLWFFLQQYKKYYQSILTPANIDKSNLEYRTVFKDMTKKQSYEVVCFM